MKRKNKLGKKAKLQIGIAAIVAIICIVFVVYICSELVIITCKRAVSAHNNISRIVVIAPKPQYEPVGSETSLT